MSSIVIRVYGILINEEKQVLVSDEWIRGDYFTKFPGGGLEFGEGTRECLQREFIEEMNLSIEVGEHIYTTDYFQRSAFNTSHQIVSIYYKVKALEPIQVSLKDTPFHFDEEQIKIYETAQQIESFRFINWMEFSAENMSLPIDKIVANILKNNG
jgi:ADP-ribose pyrophosphatase YjhB (NUDIX family)